MILLAMALAASDFPAFDTERTAALCETKRKEKTWGNIYPTNLACLADQQADYRHFIVVADANPAMHASFQRCVSEWSDTGAPDWGMIEYCAVEDVDGKRDLATLRRGAPAIVRPAVDKCKISDEDKAPDWAEIAECARTQISGHRDFMLFRAAAPDGEGRARVDACRKRAVDDEDHVIDWDLALDCAAKDSPAGVIRPDNEITIT